MSLLIQCISHQTTIRIPFQSSLWSHFRRQTRPQFHSYHYSIGCFVLLYCHNDTIQLAKKFVWVFKLEQPLWPTQYFIPYLLINLGSTVTPSGKSILYPQSIQGNICSIVELIIYLLIKYTLKICALCAQPNTDSKTFSTKLC